MDKTTLQYLGWIPFLSREHDTNPPKWTWKGQLFDWEDYGSVELPVDRALSLGFLSYIRVARASLDQSQSRDAKQKWRAGGRSHFPLEQIQETSFQYMST